MTAQEAREKIAKRLRWPLDCVPLPVWWPGAGRWGVGDASGNTDDASVNGVTGDVWVLTGLRQFHGMPTPAEVAAQAIARAEAAEASAKRAWEAVRVRDERACAAHWMQQDGDERYLDCQYCGEHPGNCLDDCPTVTHPAEVEA
jgi:hypothetical protein